MEINELKNNENIEEAAEKFACETITEEGYWGRLSRDLLAALAVYSAKYGACDVAEVKNMLDNGVSGIEEALAEKSILAFERWNTATTAAKEQSVTVVKTFIS